MSSDTLLCVFHEESKLLYLYLGLEHRSELVVDAASLSLVYLVTEAGSAVLELDPMKMA